MEIQLGRFLRSKTFAKSPRLRHLLHHIVTQWLEGNDHRLDGYNIALDVFQRDASFDSGLDPIVRVEIARLRKQLAKYYLQEGKHDPLRLEIPKGSYVPLLVDKPSGAGEPGTGDQAHVFATVAVLPFVLDERCTAISFYDNLLFLLAQVQGLRIVSRLAAVSLSSGSERRSGDPSLQPCFLVEGTASCVGQSYQLILHLSENVHGFHLWSGRYLATPHDIAETIGCAVQDLAGKLRSSVSR